MPNVTMRVKPILFEPVDMPPETRAQHAVASVGDMVLSAPYLARCGDWAVGTVKRTGVELCSIRRYSLAYWTGTDEKHVNSSLVYKELQFGLILAMSSLLENGGRVIHRRGDAYEVMVGSTACFPVNVKRHGAGDNTGSITIASPFDLKALHTPIAFNKEGGFEPYLLVDTLMYFFGLCFDSKVLDTKKVVV